jgi:hypothetical protein
MRKNEATFRQLGFDDFEVKLGDKLRGERATLGKSLLDVQKDLRIKASYIAAVENCDPDVFPNQGFIAGYVRSYARYLGIDPDETFERFCEESGFKRITSDLNTNKKKKKKSKIVEQDKSLSSRAIDMPSAFIDDSWLNHISPSGIASVSVVAGLVIGTGYLGWSVLMDIQRVEFAPIDQTPGVYSSTVDLIEPDPIDTASIDVASDDEPTFDVVEQLYRPQELAVPKVDPRDGPIAAIDPATTGVLRPEPIALPSEIATADIVFEEEYQGPVVTVEIPTNKTMVMATRAAWVRVTDAGGTILFEKILEANEAYEVPLDAVSPQLRAGNAGSVYLVVNGQPFGPIGPGTSVAKRVPLEAEAILESYAIAGDMEIPEDLSINTAANTQ